MLVQESIKASVEHARGICKSVLLLNRQLRGSDNLAERVKQLKKRVKALESAVDNALAD